MRYFTPDERVVRGSSATISAAIHNQYGDLADGTGTVTVGVTRGDGSVVLAAGTSTTRPARESKGIYQVAIPASQLNQLDWLTATWTDAGSGSTYTTIVEVVGSVYLSLDEIRSADESLADQSKYPDVQIRKAVWEVEDEFEQICEVAFVPRYRKETIDGGSGTQRTLVDAIINNAKDWILLPTRLTRRIRSVRQYDAAGSYSSFSAGEIAALRLFRSGKVERADGSVFNVGVQNIVVEYEHGYDNVPPEIKQAAIKRLRYKMNSLRTGIPDRAESFESGNGGTFRLGVAGAFKTGFPDIDSVLDRYSMRVPAIG